METVSVPGQDWTWTEAVERVGERIVGDKFSTSVVSPKWVKSRRRREREKKRILQGLRVAQAAVTERWP